ncbi:MAG: AbrB family transcriptional regulator [Thermococci archaeon]|nr:AbrB family transcriptional regulator [Thermococci archaeon]
MLAKVDSRGRLYLPKELRRGLSREVYLVMVEGGVLIVPKPEDPLKELEDIGKKLPDVPVDELRKEILSEAEKIAGE